MDLATNMGDGLLNLKNSSEDYFKLDEWSKKTIDHNVRTIKEYMGNGLSRQQAIDIVRKGTILSEQKWQEVLKKI